jgi:capsular polysaccharide biosynthesis protein
MTQLVSIESDTNLARNLLTNTIVNTNGNAYEKYISCKKRQEEDKTKLENMQTEIASMKDDLRAIKDLLLSFHK